jgi:hypothetical protein
MSAAMAQLLMLEEIDHAFHVYITDPTWEDRATKEGTITALLERKQKDQDDERREDSSDWKAPLFPDLDKFKVIYFPSLAWKT